MVVGHTGELNFQCPHIELNALAGGTRKGASWCHDRTNLAFNGQDIAYHLLKQDCISPLHDHWQPPEGDPSQAIETRVHPTCLSTNHALTPCV